MRRKIVAGNWKMNKSFAEAVLIVDELTNNYHDSSVQMIVIPPALYIPEIVNVTDGTNLEVGVQNCSEHEAGAFTGEISAKMIASVGATHIIIGHSERRKYFYEKNNQLANKINQVLVNKLTPIYCCGEALKDRKNKNQFNVVKTQIEEGLFHLSAQQIENCVIAYEPVWAIGTGVTATSNQAQEMHAFIRNLIVENYNTSTAENVHIIYGGSCNPKNAQDIFRQSDVDGGLIGGASLDAKSFIAIAKAF